MARYRVEWRIDIEAESPLQAARNAYKRYFSKNHTANVFDVTDENGETSQIDFEEIDPHG